MNHETKLYIHIPFCVKKCAYCDFLSFSCEPEVQQRYIEALCSEIKSKSNKNLTIRSVFVGGGTPSVLSEELSEMLLCTLQENFSIPGDAEFTVEANPGTLTESKAKVWREGGVNRVSMGVQTLDDTLLCRLGRIHTTEQALEQYAMLRRVGFSNLSLDLMMGLPEQTAEQWESTLKRAVSLAPEHLSCYSLIVEEGTPFFKQWEQGRLILPTEEDERRMYGKTAQILASSGYYQYEISNYSKPGYESRHNIGYWERVPYLGLGLGASSLLRPENEKAVRYKNTDNVAFYIENADHPERLQEEIQYLSTREEMEECMFLGLRMNQGVEARRFETEFGCSLQEIFGDVLRKQIGLGLVAEENGWFRLTARGRDLSNQVFVDFIE